MQTTPLTTFIQNYRWTVLAGEAAGLSDGRLLESFITCNDDAAFGALVKRHGRMVLGVCRRVLRNSHDAEDAFQATFCVLFCKAASVNPRERVGSWLHGVAYLTALKAKALVAKLHARERQMIDVPEPQAVPQTFCDDLKSLLDQELAGLPEKYRLPIVLCDLEGKSIKTATQQLAWPQGTLAGRLARARAMLAKRLTKHGVTLSGGSLALVLAENAWSAGVPVALMVSTVKNAAMVAAGPWAPAGVVSPQVAALTKGVLKNMLLSKLKAATAMLIVTAVVGGGSVRWLQQSWAAGQGQLANSVVPSFVVRTANHKLDEGGPQSKGFLGPLPQAATTQKAPSVSAWVNGKPIFEDEVFNILGPQFGKIYRETPSADRDATQQKAFNKTLEALIDNELLFQDAIRLLEKQTKMLEQLKSRASKETQKQISTMMRQMNVSTMEEYKQKLLAQGTTIESVRRMMERDTIAREYLIAKVKPRVEEQVTAEAIRTYYEDHFDKTQPLDGPTQTMIANKLRNEIANQEWRQLVKLLREKAVIVISGANSP